MGNIYGYIRVSSTDQNEDRQRILCTERASDRRTFLWTSSPARTLSGRSTGKRCITVERAHNVRPYTDSSDMKILQPTKAPPHRIRTTV